MHNACHCPAKETMTTWSHKRNRRRRHRSPLPPINRFLRIHTLCKCSRLLPPGRGISHLLHLFWRRTPEVGLTRMLLPHPSCPFHLRHPLNLHGPSLNPPQMLSRLRFRHRPSRPCLSFLGATPKRPRARLQPTTMSRRRSPAVVDCSAQAVSADCRSRSFDRPGRRGSQPSPLLRSKVWLKLKATPRSAKWKMTMTSKRRRTSCAC